MATIGSSERINFTFQAGGSDPTVPFGVDDHLEDSGVTLSRTDSVACMQGDVAQAIAYSEQCGPVPTQLIGPCRFQQQRRKLRRVARALPLQTERDDLSWGEVCGFLETFVLGHEVIKLMVRPAASQPEDDYGVIEMVGCLTGGQLNRHKPGRYYFLDRPGIDTHIGILGLNEDSFQPGSLITLDGNDYFGLVIPMGALHYVITDTNTTDWAGVPMATANQESVHTSQHLCQCDGVGRGGKPAPRHGLPYDTSRSDFSHDEAYGYLMALGICEEPVTVAVNDRNDPAFNLEATGYLRGGGFVDGDYSQRTFSIEPSAATEGHNDQRGLATFTLPIEDGPRSLATTHLNSRFALHIEGGSRSITITDAASGRDYSRSP